jgi:hypothetical protein
MDRRKLIAKSRRDIRKYREQFRGAVSDEKEDAAGR